jgi:hypothetical protein
MPDGSDQTLDRGTRLLPKTILRPMYLGDGRPAATMISAGPADPRMKIDIEVAARKRSA